MRKTKPLTAHRVTALHEIAPHVYELEIEKQYAFLPGQVVAVALEGNLTEPRLYSIASDTDISTFRILFDVNPDGWLTPRLAQMKPGDTLYVSEPFGKFIGDDSPAWWIATGTGVAPFVSMLQSGLGHNKTLLHGARTLDKFFHQQQFADLLQDRYLRFCTTQEAPGVHLGRLTLWLKAQTNLPKDIKYYLCGNADMVVEVREILVEQLGIPYENVMAEIYF